MSIRKIIYNLIFWSVFVYALWVIVCEYAPDFTPATKILWSGPIAGTIAILFAAIKANSILTEKINSEKLKHVTGLISKGVVRFINEEYSITLLIFLVLFALIFAYVGRGIAACFALGAMASALSGLVGMFVASRAHGVAAEASETSLNRALNAIFSSGLITGLGAVGFTMIFIPVLFFLLKDPDVMPGFALGATAFALFASAGGGIFAKAASIASRLTKKIESNISENDIKNPVFAADKTALNAGGIGSMSADLFQTYACAIIAAMVLGSRNLDLLGVFVPLTLASVGIFATIIGSLFVRIKENKNPHSALQMGEAIAMIIFVGLSYYLLEKVFTIDFFIPVLIGVLTGIVLRLITRYYTDGLFSPVKSIARLHAAGSEMTAAAGFRTGMLSVFLPILIIILAAAFAFHYAGAMRSTSYYTGVYGVSIAAVSMLSTTAMMIALNAFGPVANNARAVAKISQLNQEAFTRLNKLNVTGDKTTAIGKGFAIGASTLTALALFFAFVLKVDLIMTDILNPFILIALLFGASLPFLFAALLTGSALKAAEKMANETKRQIDLNRGIVDGSVEPDYKRCVNIPSHAAIAGVILPGAIAVLSPIGIGLIIKHLFGIESGAQAVAAVFAGAIVSGVCLAIALSNSNSASDNAKDIVQADDNDGYLSYRASLRDYTQESLNVLIKIMPLIALIFAHLFIAQK